MSSLLKQRSTWGAVWFAAFACLPSSALTDSQISAVTVYGRGAVVTRNVDLASMGSSQSVIIEGLPSSLDVQSLRLRAAGYEVVSVESVLRRHDASEGDRLVELERLIKAAELVVEGAEDDLEIAKLGLRYSGSLIDRSQAMMRKQLGVGTGRFDRKDWIERTKFLAKYDAGARSKVNAANADLLAARKLLNELQPGGPQVPEVAPTYDVTVQLQGLPNGASLGEPRLSLEYFVPNAAWAPRYDLRANKALDSVELAYRASVQQGTGEDWNDVPITLSTAKPERGASGPAPQMSWVDLWDPNADVSIRASIPEMEALGYVDSAYELNEEGLPSAGFQMATPGADFNAKLTYAAVDSTGLAVRFQLAQNETVESRNEPSVLLIGRSTLSMDVEHFAAPSMSDLVWMRGKAVNTSDWNMIAGPVAVYVAGDFVGNASTADVAAGAEFDVPLGPDHGLGLVRTLLADSKGSRGGAFSRSKSTDLERWSLELTNFGGAGARPDGSVRVIVQEVLARSQDEDLEIELEGVTPALSKDKRFDMDREERGILTWVIDVPKAGKRVMQWSRSMTWPEGRSLQRR